MCQATKYCVSSVSTLNAEACSGGSREQASNVAMEHGICNDDGWWNSSVQQAKDVNCTFVGSQSWIPSSASAVLFGACAKMVRHSLERHTLSSLDRVRRGAGIGVESAVLVFENEDSHADDPDGTRKSLRQWAARDTSVRLVLSQQLSYPVWSKTQRIGTPS